ncbi:MAG: 5-methyltetrahydropteroyltriglutamate--homocysteine S-methyltransferase [Paludibacteraceae bacterium]|nr:5-methyltetrahydropteroyltriglutamate--homocysteine S-methyltransferase [Paludibacteraceae bacterium]
MTLKTNVLGYPRVGANRELKKAEEAYWAGKVSKEELLKTAAEIRKSNWNLQKEAGIDLIPSNDFSFYDQTLDLSLCVGAIPERYNALKNDRLDLYFAMAHGYQKNGIDVTAMEMTKWFDTNYHYIVPEFSKNQQFSLLFNKAAEEFKEALALGIKTKPVLIGPITYLLLGKEKEKGFNRVDLIDRLLPVYLEILRQLESLGAEYVQIDEPVLATDINEDIKSLYRKVFAEITKATKLKIVLATYFDSLADNTDLATELNVSVLHIDLVRAPQQWKEVVRRQKGDTVLSLGVVDGRNIWKNDFAKSLEIIEGVKRQLGENRVIISTSCSLLHSPFDLDNEKNEKSLPAEVKRWMAFARQKVNEVVTLAELAGDAPSEKAKLALKNNILDIENRRSSVLTNNEDVKKRMAGITPAFSQRKSPFATRIKEQRRVLNLPLFPTTTIGSFPQTVEVRSWRSKFKKGELSKPDYTNLLKGEIEKTIRKQEEIGLDVLVHGEAERNDMVEYFGEQLSGFAFTQNGWVQSYGSRCVKPPVIYGDVARPKAMTIDWITYAQSLTDKPVKGMLTGPVTILQWSFVRNDQPRAVTMKQIALAIRDEVVDLEKAGIKVIQIDEPAIREGLPLRKSERKAYLDNAVEAFRISASGVKDETQIHTHMCYCEFNDIIEHIALMDADVITIECARSQMELLDSFVKFKYPNEIGPGVYDIHSPRVPSVDEMVALMQKAAQVISPSQLWVNPDCGLKTRGWAETEASLRNMVEAAKKLRQ